MGSYYLRKRGFLFGDDDNIVQRGDFAEEAIGESLVDDSGKPVPVLFGTRWVAPTVVTWRDLADQITRYYKYIIGDNQVEFSDYPITVEQTQTLEPVVNNVPMLILSMRMVFCLGGVDALATIGRVNGREFHLSGQRDLPPAASDGATRRALYEAFRSNRVIVSTTDADVLGWRNGGLGVPGWAYRERYYQATQYLEFWFSDGADNNLGPTKEELDRGTRASGVTCFFFDNFNFGGKSPLAKWQMRMTRIGTLTQRASVIPDGTKAGRYIPQWYPEKSRISMMTAPDEAYLYYIILSQTLTRAQREYIRTLLKTLPYEAPGNDEREFSRYRYRIFYLGYNTDGAPVSRGSRASSIFDNPTDFERELDSYVNAVSSSTRTLQTRVNAPDPVEWIRILKNYADTINLNITHSLREQGIVAMFTTDLVGAFGGSTALQAAIADAISAQNLMARFKFPPLQTDGPSFAETGNPYTARQLKILQEQPPEYRVFIWQYLRFPLTGPTAQWRISVDYTLVTRASYFFGSDAVNRIGRSDSTGAAILIPLSTRYPTDQDISSYYVQLQQSGWSMNPVHALREALTDPDWGQAIPNSLIEDSSFRIAADRAYEEKLDYSYIHQAEGGADELINSILQYLDAVCFYDPTVDRVRLRLIRRDYSVADLEVLNDSNIASVHDYSRQHAEARTNSITVKYHDAILGTNESVTVQDLDGVSLSGGVINETFNYPGCATRDAATRVANRELVGLSGSIVGLKAVVNESVKLSLGDPVLFSYSELEIDSMVMRVMRINYTDGIKPGIEYELLQDIFYDPIRFGDIQVDEAIHLSPAVAPDLPDLDLIFAEVSEDDFFSNGLSVTPTAGQRFIKYTYRHDPAIDSTTQVFIGGNRALPAGAGYVLNEIPDLSVRPDLFSYTITVDYLPVLGAELQSLLVRVDDEIFRIGSVTRVGDNYELLLMGRALNDTVATQHSAGATIVYLRNYNIQAMPWDGSVITTDVTKNLFTTRDQFAPTLTFHDRALSPYPPEYVRIRNNYSNTVKVDGAIALTFKPRFRDPAWAGTQETTIDVYEGTTVLYSNSVTAGSTNEHTERVGVDVLGTGTKNLRVVVASRLNAFTSWQQWEIMIDWSRTSRRACGFGNNWNNDWGGDDCEGFGYDFDERFGA